MKIAKFDFYRELMNRTTPDGNPLHNIFWRHDGGANNYNFSKAAPDLSGLSNNVFFAIQETPAGAENANFRIVVYDYENPATEINAYTVYFKTYGNHEETAAALEELRTALDKMQTDIFYKKLDISQ